MSLRRTCRELVLEVVLKKALAAVGDGLDRLQIVVDDAGLRVLNSFLRMGDLHAEGVTSMELLEKSREPLPGLDALYFLSSDSSNIDRVLEDFKSAASPQHRQVHFCFTQPLSTEMFGKLAEAAHLAPRVKSFVEVPLSFVVVQDRGFHFDMPQALPGLFPVPDHQLVTRIVRRLVDVCRCLQATAPIVRHGQSELCRDVAEQVASELLTHKSSGPPCQLLILDRSVDIAAALVHEYTYEACIYDVLDGNMLDADRNVVTLQPQQGSKQVLLSDNDPIWEELKHLHVAEAHEEVGKKLKDLLASFARGQKESHQVSTSALLDQIREAPELRDAKDRIDLHATLVQQAFERIGEDRLDDDVGCIEQDIACGVDKAAKEVKVANLQKEIQRIFSERKQLSSETKLRLLMLYFACVANITEAVRQRLMEMAELETDHHQVLLNMMRTRLMEGPESSRNKQGGTVHRNSKAEVARFKKNTSDGRFNNSRFEPRVKELLIQLAEHRLSREEFPVLDEGSAEGTGSFEGLRQAGAALESHGAPMIQAADEWSFAGYGGASGPGSVEAASHEVTQRVVIFVLGGFTLSELRSAAEVERTMPRGTEVLIGGTSLLTPQRLIRALRTKARDMSADELLGADVANLT